MLTLKDCMDFCDLTEAECNAIVGSTYVSGVVGFTQDSDNNTDKKESTFAIVPTVGYFVNTNLAIGLGVGYVNNKVEATNVTNVSPYLTLTEKGKDINYGTESSKSKDIESSISKETSLSDSKSKSLERTVDIQATMMMQEVDFLVKKLLQLSARIWR